MRLFAASLALLAACGGEAVPLPALPGLPMIVAAASACPAPGSDGCYLTAAERAALLGRVGDLRRKANRLLLRVAEERRGSVWRQRRVFVAAAVAVVAVRSIVSDRVDLRSLDDNALVDAEGRYLVLDEAGFRARLDALVGAR